MKRYFLILKLAIVFLLVTFLYACSKRNLENVANSGTFLKQDYFKTEEQSYSVLVGAYNYLIPFSGILENMTVFFNAGTNDFYSGGGSSSDLPSVQRINNYTIDAQTAVLEDYWKNFYQGINECNLLIENIDKTEMDENLRNRFIGEAKVLRSFYYFKLVEIFGNIPLILHTFNFTDDFYNIPPSDPKAIYKQIEGDIEESLLFLPKKNTGEERGRITEGSARAILGKVYLFDQKKEEAAEQFRIVNGTPGEINEFGFSLLSNFNDLWLPGNGSDFNSEAIFSVVHTNKSEADRLGNVVNFEGNIVIVDVNPRNYVLIGTNAPKLGPGGFGVNPISPDFEEFMKGDPRYDATILDAGRLQDEGQISYVESYQGHGFYLNKFISRDEETTKLPGNAIINYYRNFMIIRLADTYLMEAEALGAEGSRAQELLDAVRARVQLTSIPVSMQAIKNERRRELAGEGIRWFDLVRWGDAGQVLGNKGFVVGKNEIFPIPFQELANTQLIQNPLY